MPDDTWSFNINQIEIHQNQNIHIHRLLHVVPIGIPLTVYWKCYPFFWRDILLFIRPRGCDVINKFSNEEDCQRWSRQESITDSDGLTAQTNNNERLGQRGDGNVFRGNGFACASLMSHKINYETYKHCLWGHTATTVKRIIYFGEWMNNRWQAPYSLI